MKKTIILAWVSIIFFITACTDSNNNGCVDQPDISEVSINLEIEYLHDKLLNVESKEELRSILKKHRVITTYFLKPEQYPNEDVMIDELFKKFSNPHIDSLQMEIDRVFGNLSSLESDLKDAFAHLKYYYPETQVPKIKTVATGFAHDMYISDSLIVIGLDYYLGKGAKYRPIGMFNYMLERYAPEYIVPSIMLLYGISSEYNKTDLSDNTMLADMVAYGKSFVFAKHMMPCTPDSVMIWYTSKEIAGVHANEDIIWAHFVEEELLFENNHMIKKKYIEPRPKTYEIGEKAPGRIGTWLGWQIVKSYMGQKDLTLQEVMKQQDPRALFNESKYRPSKN